MTEQRLQEIKDAKLQYFSIEGDQNIDWEEVDLLTLKKLDAARKISGVPYHITSNYRTLENPAGFATDAHRDIPCKAFDIACVNSHQLFRIVLGLILVGFVRIGVNKKNNHIHVDASTTRVQEVLFLES